MCQNDSAFDVFVSTTGKDDANLVSCEIATRVFDVPRCIARVNTPKNMRIFREVGIECVSSTALIATIIEEDAMLGGIIGFEREYRSKEAGFRTHFLVGLGSGLFMILSLHGFDDFVGIQGIQRDPSRIAAQVVSGMGFIGAGTIIFQKNVVKGLTTAAGLWVTSAIGMTAGAGMYGLAGVSTLLVILCLEGSNFIHHRIFHEKPED